MSKQDKFWLASRVTEKIMTVLIAQAVSSKYDQAPFHTIYCSLWSLQLTLSRFVAFYFVKHRNLSVYPSQMCKYALKKS